MDALQQRKNLAAARKKYRPLNQAEILIRRRKLRELFGCGYTKAQMREILSAYMVEKGYPEVSQHALTNDLKTLARDYRETVGQDVKTLTEEADMRLAMLAQHQWGDYLDARERGKNPALLSDNIRKTEEARQKLLGLHVQKHQHTGELSVMQRIQALIEVKPQQPLEVVPLLEDEDFAILPAPVIRADA